MTAVCICAVCGEWNRGVAELHGLAVCGRASCLATAVDLAAQGEAVRAHALESDDPGLD